MADKVKQITAKATIDCSMVVIKTKEAEPKSYGFNVATQVGVEANIETRNAITLTVKDVVKAQKPEKRTLTGHTLTLTDAMLIMELLPLCNGGSLVMDEDQKTVKGYKPPAVGEEIEKTKFDLTLYSAVMEGSSIVAYEATTYPSCEAQPVAPGNAEDDVFSTHELTIISSPGAGESPYTLDFVEALPEFEETAGA